MKTVTIQSVIYKIVDYTPRRKYIKTIIFTFQIDNKEFDVKITNLDKHASRVFIPFSNESYYIPDFKSIDNKRRINELDFLCRAFTNYSFEVGTYKNLIFHKYLEDLIIEKISLKYSVEKISRNLYSCFFDFVNFESDSDFEIFKTKLIHYYANQERVTKLKNLNHIANNNL